MKRVHPEEIQKRISEKKQKNHSVSIDVLVDEIQKYFRIDI